MNWDDIQSWPNAALSRRVTGPVHRWHVQEAGDGPLVLLLHGAGGSTHSFRDMIGPLSARARIVALDLPGHGFTQLGNRIRASLSAMTEDIAALARQEGWQPDVILGHSAGGAVALNLSRKLLSPRGQPPHIIGINAALGEFKGLAGWLFPLTARMLSVMPFSATLFSGAAAHPERITAMIGATGSEVSAEGIALYRRLVADRAHVSGTLQMMAQWDLPVLLRALPDLTAPVTLIAGSQDTTVPPEVSQAAAARMASATAEVWDGYGHLLHEECPDQVADAVLRVV